MTGSSTHEGEIIGKEEVRNLGTPRVKRDGNPIENIYLAINIVGEDLHAKNEYI